MSRDFERGNDSVVYINTSRCKEGKAADLDGLYAETIVLSQLLLLITPVSCLISDIVCLRTPIRFGSEVSAEKSKSACKDEGRVVYDLAVLGGGVAGLSTAMEASALGKKVVICNWVKPTPKGSIWGFGGTCLNVGCLPKKLMHITADLNTVFKDAIVLGWNSSGTPKHDWSNMVTNIQTYLQKVRVNYEKKLIEKGAKFYEAKASILCKNKVLMKKDNCEIIVAEAKNILIATGRRPKYLGLHCEKELCITSDDLFSMKEPPGDTIIIGASFVGLECAGILTDLGFKVTILARDECMHGLDQQMVALIAKHLENHGVKFIRKCVAVSFHRTSDNLIAVEGCSDNKLTEYKAKTVLLAIGRQPDLADLGLESNSIAVKEGCIVVDDNDQTSVSGIYALGDVAYGRPQFSSIASKAGVTLARRLFGGSTSKMDYSFYPVNVCTPLEYAFIGVSEEAAMSSHGADNIDVYHTYYKPLENTLSYRDLNLCYAKVVCVKNMNNRVVGLHVTGNSAGEIVQGFALAIKMGVNFSDFQNLIGVYPTSAEIFTKLKVTKASGLSVEKSDC